MKYTNIELTKEESLVILECFDRYETEGKIYFTHPSEYIVFQKIHAQIEKQTPELFNENYYKELQKAQPKIAKNFEGEVECLIDDMSLQHFFYQDILPGIDGFTFKDGKVLCLQERKCLPSYTFEETTIKEEAKKYEGNIVSRFQIYKEILHLEGKGSICYGECEMGNEGFIFYKNEFGMIEWSFFQSFANPFVKAYFKDSETVIATTEIDFEFTIPIYNPQNLFAISKNNFGWG